MAGPHLIALEGALVFEEARIEIPNEAFLVGGLGKKDLDEIEGLVGVEAFAQDVLVDAKDVGIEVGLEIGVAPVFRERAKEPQVVMDITEMGIAARVDMTLFARM